MTNPAVRSKPDFSAQKTDGSTERDSGVETKSNGALGCRHVFCIDGVVKIAGIDKEQINVMATEKKITVEIRPDKSEAADSNKGMHGKDYTVSFFSPLRQETVSDPEEGRETESIEWDPYNDNESLSAWVGLHDLTKTDVRNGKQVFMHQRSRDSGFSRPESNSISSSEQNSPTDECEKNLGGVDVESASGVTMTGKSKSQSESSGSEVSLGTPSINSLRSSVVSESYSSPSDAASRLRFKDIDQIRRIAENIEVGSNTKKTSDLILEVFITYQLKNVPNSINDLYTGRHSSIMIQRFMFGQCALKAGWGLADAKKSKQQYPVFIDEYCNKLCLDPNLMFSILNQSNAFERIAEVRHYRVDLIQSIRDRLSRTKKDFDYQMLYQFLSFEEFKVVEEEVEDGQNITAQKKMAETSSSALQPSKAGGELPGSKVLPGNKNQLRQNDKKNKRIYFGKHDKKTKDYFRKNTEKLLDKCDPACMKFIIDFCSLLDAAENLSKEACKRISQREIQIIPSIGKQDSQKKLSTQYSTDLLKACVKLRLAVDLVERKLLPTGLDRFQDRTENEVVGIEGDTDYSGISESDRNVMRHLLTIMDGLEKETNNIVTEMERDIDKFPRRNTEGKSFEERVLELKKVEKGYVIKPFEGVREIFSRILGITDHSSGQAISVGDGSTSSQFFASCKRSETDVPHE